LLARMTSISSGYAIPVAPKQATGATLLSYYHFAGEYRGSGNWLNGDHVRLATVSLESRRNIDQLLFLWNEASTESAMRRDLVISNMLGAGLDSRIAEKAADAKLTLTDLRHKPAKELRTHFADHEVKAIVDSVKRKPFEDAVVLELIDKCDWACCLCWNLDNRVPIIIHHMREHSISADDSYDNLVVLCLNHHAIAHSKWEISQAPATPEYIRNRKKEFEIAIAAFKEGKRAAPGREGDGSTPETQSDVQSLKRIGEFMNRPAMFRRMEQEGNMRDFQAEMTNVIRALSIGKLETRQGDRLGEVKPILSFSNPQWRDRLVLLRNEIDNLRMRLEIAIRDGDLHISPAGDFYCFNNRDLPHEIDDMKRASAALLNSVLIQAGLPEIRGPEPSH